MIIRSKNLFLLLLCFLVLGSSYCFAYKTLDNGPIHEAYMTQELGALLIVAIEKTPPETINEAIPHQQDPQTQWISGYWAWAKELNDFVWISGIWRRPPPGYYWISGYWKKYNEGWVWIQGFWSHVQTDDLAYIEKPPPERFEEKVPNPPGEDYFWVSGSWIYDIQSEKYVWLAGRFEKLSKNWILVPSHYFWRPGGYVFIPNYWDWDSSQRGTIYKSITIEEEDRKNLTYEPKELADLAQIAFHYFPSYPNYTNYFFHRYVYDKDFSDQFQSLIPIWWKWQKWWTLTHKHQWSLWWWYTHPGYPSPSFLTQEMAKEIPPPKEQLLQLMKESQFPVIISPLRVLDQTELISAKQELTQERKDLVAPIMPYQIEKLSAIFEEANKQFKETKQTLRPEGKEPTETEVLFFKNAPDKPVFLNDKQNEASKKVTLPPKPKVTEVETYTPFVMNHNLDLSMADYVQTGPVYRNPCPSQINRNPYPPPPSPPQGHLPYYPEVEEHNINHFTTQPITPHPSLQSNQEKIPSPYPENLLPKAYEETSPCPYHTYPFYRFPPPPVPSADERDVILHPLPRMQQDQGFLMNRPQPQENAGVSAHNSTGFRSKDRDWDPTYP